MEASSRLLSVEFVIEESAVTDFLADVKQSSVQVEADPKAWDIPPELLDEYGDAQMDPFMVVAVAMSVGFLIKRLADVWWRAGGQVIDVRGRKVVVRRAPYLEPRTLVLVTEDGPKVFKGENRDEALEVLRKMVGPNG